MTHCCSRSSGVVSQQSRVKPHTLTHANSRPGHAAWLFTHTLGWALWLTGNEAVNWTRPRLSIGTRRFRICALLKSPGLMLRANANGRVTWPLPATQKLVSAMETHYIFGFKCTCSHWNSSMQSYSGQQDIWKFLFRKIKGLLKRTCNQKSNVHLTWKIII